MIRFHIQPNNTGLDKQKFAALKCKFAYPSVLRYVLGAQKNILIEMALTVIGALYFQ